jgi:Tetratricopeptide repeat
LPRLSERRLHLVAVAALASVLAVVALAFGAWATMTGSYARFGRWGAMTGVIAAVLAAVLAGVGRMAWARLTRGGQPPLTEPAQTAPAVSGISGLRSANGQVVVGDIPHAAPGWLPRADLLVELDRASGPVVAVHSATEAPGVGTTQLAAAYARAKLADGWRLVAWVSAADRGGPQAGVAAVAEALGAADGGTGHGGDAGLAVRQRLEANGDRCLVVFDDAVDLDGLRPFLPGCGSARVLVTSGRGPTAGGGACVPVGAFSAGEALAFLAGRTGLADAEGAGALARELGYLPLALALAAGVIAAERLAYGGYLDRLRALSDGAHLAQEEGQSCPPGVAGAIMLSLDSAPTGDQANVGARIMEMMAVLSAAGVRRGLLCDAGSAGVLAIGGQRAALPADRVEGALARLVERSLLTFSLDGETVVGHPLVMSVVRDALARRSGATAVCRAAASVLSGRAQALVRSPDRPAIRDLTGQIAALQETTTGSACETDDELAKMMLRLRSWALYYLTVLGDSAPQAIDAGEPVAADAALLLGPGHPDTLASRNNLAIAYQAVGRAAEAIPLLEQTLAGRERELGPDHPDTLVSRHNLSYAYQEASRATEAIPLLEQALAGRERVLGPDDPDTLASRENLAIAYQAVGRAAEAIPLLEQTLAAFARVLGPDHPRTLILRESLASAYRDAGLGD